MKKDTHKGNGIEQLAGEKYQTNIVEFPLVIQMERILREATRIERKTKELLKKAKSMR